MPTRSSGSALQAAIKGDKVTDRQAQSALGQAVSKIANLTKRSNATKDAMKRTGSMMIHAAETQGSLVLSSMAEGYFGEDKLKIGQMDIRAPVGLSATVYGLYDTIKGNKKGGTHALAVGNGVMGSWLASVGRKAGQALAAKRGAPTSAAALMPQLKGTPFQALLTEPPRAQAPREVVLTPRAEGRRRYAESDEDLG